MGSWAPPNSDINVLVAQRWWTWRHVVRRCNRYCYKIYLYLNKQHHLKPSLKKKNVKKIFLKWINCIFLVWYSKSRLGSCRIWGVALWACQWLVVNSSVGPQCDLLKAFGCVRGSVQDRKASGEHAGHWRVNWVSECFQRVSVLMACRVLILPCLDFQSEQLIRITTVIHGRWIRNSVWQMCVPMVWNWSDPISNTLMLIQASHYSTLNFSSS